MVKENAQNVEIEGNRVDVIDQIRKEVGLSRSSPYLCKRDLLHILGFIRRQKNRGQ